MSNVLPNKVEMSLDDIIKLTKFGKGKQKRKANRQGRGNRAADGIPRGRGGAPSRGRGGAVSRGLRQTINPVKQFHTGLQRGGRGQGRGRGINRQNPGVSPLNRNSIDQQNVRGRGRRRGRGGRGTGVVFTNSRIGQLTLQQQTFSPQQTAQQRRGRLNKVRQQAALLKEQRLAIKNLQQAQKNIQTINMAIQKTSRDNVVNQLRGINTTQTGQSRGRGRKLLSGLNRLGSDNLLNSAVASPPPIRQLSNTSVTITNMSAAVGLVSTSAGRRKRWRNKNKSQIPSEHFTIQVASQNAQPVRQQQSSILNELKMLKPAVTTTYQFQKSVFATPATGVSLNDRFSGTTFVDGADDVKEERKVFI